MAKFILIVLLQFLFACEKNITSSAIAENAIVGKWSPTYFQSTKNASGTWSKYEKVNTFAPLPVLEFTNNGSFLNEGKSAASCCYGGNKFTVSNNKLVFSEKIMCAASMNCNECLTWNLEFLPKDTVVIEECSLRSKYVKLK